MDEKGTKDSRDSASFIFSSLVLSSFSSLSLSLSPLSSLFPRVLVLGGILFRLFPRLFLLCSFLSLSLSLVLCFSLSDWRNCRYQTLVCALITPRTSFLLRSSGLTTISSSIATMKRIRGKPSERWRVAVSAAFAPCSRFRRRATIPSDDDEKTRKFQ